MSASTPSPLAAYIDHRLGEPGSEVCYGFVVFPSDSAGDSIRIGYTTPPPGPGSADLWQANWGIAFPGHFGTAARMLAEAGILRTRDGVITIQLNGWEEPRPVAPARILGSIRLRSGTFQLA